MKCSPGKFDGIVPRTFFENLIFRRALVRWVTAEGEDDHVHEARRDLIWSMCQEDPFFYFDAFVWTYNPREDAPSIPFILYDFQREAIASMAEALGNEDFVIEKSRDMGASWLCCGLFEWAWHFLPQKTSFLLVSRKEDLVDKAGDMKSLMARLDFTLERQPRWLLPRSTRIKLSLTNHDNGSAINGESTTGDVARGDRRTAILLDEFASVENDYAVLKSTRDATNCRIFNSTPKGARGAFYDMRCKETVRKFRFHWTLHPGKARGLYTDEVGNVRSPWYDGEVARCVSLTEVKQELDIDYNASESQFFDEGVLDRLSTHTRDPSSVYHPAFDDILGTLRDLEPSPKGELRFWGPYSFTQPPPPRDYIVACDISQGTGATPSVASIGDVSTGERIGELVTSTRKPHEFAALVVGLCKWLHTAFLIWEVNGPGSVFTDTVIELGYRNVYHRTRLGQYHADKTPNLGWASNKTSKLRLLSDYRRALHDQVMINYSKASLDECRNYTFGIKGEVQHTRLRASTDDGSGNRENHGDRVIADALLAFALLERSVGRGKGLAALQLAPPPCTFAHRRMEAEKRMKAAASW